MTPGSVPPAARRARAVLLRVVAFAGMFVLLVGAGTAGLSVNTHAPDGTGPVTAVDTVEHSLRQQGTPDAVIASLDKGEITETRSLGDDEYGPDTPFFIGSASKSFTAMAVARLVQQDRLDLDDPVVTYLPWFRAQGAYEDITVRHLVNQTSGLPTWAGQVDLFQPELGLDERVRELASVQMTSAPGEEFHYCNKNFAVVGMIIEAVTGKPYAEALSSEVLDPLEMTHTHTSAGQVGDGELAGGTLVMFGASVPWPTPDFPGALPDGYLISTARDMAAFADVVATGRHDGNQFLSPELLDTLQTPPEGVAPDPNYASTYAMGVRLSDVRGQEMLWHEGELATFHADYGVFGDRTGLVVLVAHKSQMYDGDSPFFAGMETAAGGAPAPDDGGYRTTAFAMIVAAGLLLTLMIADLTRWPWRLRQDRRRRLIYHALPRTVLGILITAGTFIGLGLTQGLPGPLPLEMAWTGAADVTVLVLGTSAYLLISAAVLGVVRSRT